MSNSKSRSLQRPRGSKRRSPRKRENGARGAGSLGRLFEDLVALQDRLRAPGGCPWDQEQTPQSLRTFLIEEAYEALDALEEGDSKKFAAELGDLMLQIVFHSLLAQEQGRFDISQVIRSVHDKMVRRHPHVFGKARAKTSAQVLKHWEEIKAAERAEGSSETAQADVSLLRDAPRSLPALPEALQMTRRAATVGFDWENVEGILEKLAEEVKELRSALDAKRDRGARNPAASARVEEEIGDILFAAANVARFLGADPEIALKRANRKFRRRFEWMERQAKKEGRRLADVPRARMEELWNESKARA